jgi:polysaccharide biosynthesis/export protein
MKTKSNISNTLANPVDALRESARISGNAGPRPCRFVSPLIIATLVTAALLMACQQPKPSTPGSSPAAALPPSPMRLQEGDVIRVTFEAETNLNTTAKVQLDGSISLPWLQNVKAVGKTTEELQAELTQLYKPLVKANQLTVALASAAASVYVSGAVLRPGRIAMERPLTVLDAIMEAGGFDYNRAKLSDVKVFRVENGSQQQYRLDLKRTMKGQDSSLFYLKPFDTVHVPEKVFNL